MKAELVDSPVEKLPERDEALSIGALRQSQRVGAAERVEEDGILPHVVGERSPGQLSRRDALDEHVLQRGPGKDPVPVPQRVGKRGHGPSLRLGVASIAEGVDDSSGIERGAAGEGEPVSFRERSDDPTDLLLQGTPPATMTPRGASSHRAHPRRTWCGNTSSGTSR